MKTSLSLFIANWQFARAFRNPEPHPRRKTRVLPGTELLACITQITTIAFHSTTDWSSQKLVLGKGKHINWINFPFLDGG